jgi:hypothetical protein
MTKSGTSHNAFIKMLIVSTVFLLTGIVPSLGQNKKLNNSVVNLEDGWWKPVLQKHNIDLKQFNYKNTFVMGMNDTINNLCLEIGNSDSLNNKKIPYKDAILISKGAGQTYWVITSEYARHDLDNNLLILRNGQMACYDFNSQNLVPIDTSSFQDLSIDIKKNSMRISSKN